MARFVAACLVTAVVAAQEFPAPVGETFTPRFRDGAYAQGIREGTARVADIIRKNETLTLEQRAALAAPDTELQQAPTWIIVAFLSVFVGVGAMVTGNAVGTKTIAPILPGLLFTGMPLWFALLVGSPTGIGILVLLAVIVLMLAFRHGRRQLARGKVGRAGRGWVFGSSGGSGRSSGGSSSSSSSGGSFGGGRSGGGGASGRW